MRNEYIQVLRINLQHLIISGKRFSMEFENKDYYQEKFTGLFITGETVSAVSFEECEFGECSLIDCKFEKCRFLNCTFDNCSISALIPMDCRLRDVTFTGCKVIGTDWTKAQKIEGLAFIKSVLDFSSFRMMKLPGLKMTECQVKESEFIEADLTGSDLTGTDFEGSRFHRTNLSGANMEGATNYSIDINNNNLKKTRFSLPEALSLLNSLDIIIE